MNIDKLIDDLIRREGEYVNNPADNGGPTKYGITIKTLSLWLARDASEADIVNLDKRTAHEIYYSWYYIKPGINSLPQLIQPVMIDINADKMIGTKRAFKILQDALLCHGFYCGSVDGNIRDKTLDAVNEAAANMGWELVRTIVRRRIIEYENIVRNDETKREFLGAWINRAESFI